MKNIRLLAQSSVRIEAGKVTWIDPYQIREETHDADHILITHDHFDHFSPEDIAKVAKESTEIFVPAALEGEARKLGLSGVKIVKPGDRINVEPSAEEGMGLREINAIPSYNTNKDFHPKEARWVGYILRFETEDGPLTVYHAGDTDATDEARGVKCDVAMVPIGGTYTMTAEEAAELVNEIKPKTAVPIHYATIVGTLKDAETFRAAVDPGIEVEIIKEY